MMAEVIKNLDELHDKLFDILCIIDDICTENNINYYLDAGTELGAVREGDFIAWDDDADIKILLEDLDRFRDTMNSELPEHLHFMEPSVYKPYFYDFIYRIYDDRWLLHEETEEDIKYKNYNNRVGADIFVFGKAPNNKVSQHLMLLMVKILYGLGMAHRVSINYDKYTRLQKVYVKLLCFLGKYVSVDQIHNAWLKLIKKYSNRETGYRLDTDSPIKCIRIYPAELYEKAVYKKIRNRLFPVPMEYDRDLTMIYGDYMTPVKDDRIYTKHYE